MRESGRGTLSALERSPAGLHGEPWRWGTALVVQEGWAAGEVLNLVGLVLVGVAAEQVVERRARITAYVGTGLVGQVFGHA